MKKTLATLPKQRHFGLKWQQFDPRDCKFKPLVKAKDTVVPAKADLTTDKAYPSVYNQGDLGSCVSNGVAFCVQFDQIKQKEAPFMPSRLFIYYNGRVIEGTVKEDSGLEIRDGVKVVANVGVCPEKELPYNVAKFKSKPSAKCYKDALKETAVVYEAVNNAKELDIKAAIASGFPVVFGATLYGSFESDTVAKTGIVPMPGTHEEVLGGHCMVIVGYDDTDSTFLIRNSWGSNWGINGHCKIPYAYLTNTNLAGDFWVIRSVK